MLQINYKDLGFYKKSYEFTLQVYKINFPKEETYGLASQLKRASSSIPLNIAEGSSRSTMKDFKSFLHNALGSARECLVTIQLLRDLNIITLETYCFLEKMLNEIIGTMTNYMKKMEVN